jgi:hypothetical protein
MATRYQYLPKRKKLSLIGLLFAKKVREVKCTTCGRPYIEHPDLESDQWFRHDNVELQLYRDFSQGEPVFKTRVGVWRREGYQSHFSDLFTFEEMKSLVRVIREAAEFIEVEKEVNQKGAIKKMSSR